jgi:hypothetical protein
MDRAIPSCGAYWNLPFDGDGRLEVLCTFFSRSDTTLTKVTLSSCDFGTAQDSSQLLAAFESNRTVTDLTLSNGIRNLEGAALGASLSSLMQNMPQLQRLEYASPRSALRVEGRNPCYAAWPAIESDVERIESFWLCYWR